MLGWSGVRCGAVSVREGLKWWRWMTMLANELSCLCSLHTGTRWHAHTSALKERGREIERARRERERAASASFCLSVAVVVSNFNFILLQRTNCAPSALLSVSLRLSPFSGPAPAFARAVPAITRFDRS